MLSQHHRPMLKPWACYKKSNQCRRRERKESMAGPLLRTDRQAGAAAATDCSWPACVSEAAGYIVTLLDWLAAHMSLIIINFICYWDSQKKKHYQYMKYNHVNNGCVSTSVNNIYVKKIRRFIAKKKKSTNIIMCPLNVPSRKFDTRRGGR